MRMIPLGGRQIGSRDEKNDFCDATKFLSKTRLTLYRGVSSGDSTHKYSNTRHKKGNLLMLSYMSVARGLKMSELNQPIK